MPYYRTDLTNGHSVCITAESEAEALATAKHIGWKFPKVLYTTPYPTHPKLNPGDGCPAFCLDKPECRGRSACPRAYSCTE